MRDLFKGVWRSNTVAGARDYVSANANSVSKKVVSVAKPYQELAKENVDSAKTFVSGKVQEVKSADSISRLIEIIVGLIMSVIRLLLRVVRTIRDYVYQKYQSQYIGARNRVEEIVDNVKSKASELPNSPVGRKVEEVSKKVFGDSRHDQAVEFIKSNVIPMVHKSYDRVMPASVKSPVSSASTTEGGSISASSPLGQQERQNKAKAQSQRKK